ncbi:MAG: SMI1/KNR4 family protein [Planctomycetota bacterium]
MKTPTSKAGTPTSWAQLIESKYGCRLSSDLTDWFDAEIWREHVDDTGDQFLQPVAAEELLSDAPRAIWPALMPCDLLPLVGNGMGDWLCLRIRNDNTAREIVHWYHGGGDWIPWGDGIAQALLFAHLRRRLPQGNRDYAPGLAVRRSHPASKLTQWATNHVDQWSHDLTDEVNGGELADEMIRLRLCEPAVRCQLVIDALGERPFDPTESGDQAWQAAATHATAITQLAPYLAWGWDIAGYAKEREGERKQAIELYREGLQCSAFTDQCVRIGTEAMTGGGNKFAALRLTDLNHEPRDDGEREYLTAMHLSTDDARRRSVYDHFEKQATVAERSVDFPRAVKNWFRAGWDLGAEPLQQFEVILTSLATCAAQAGFDATATLARTHALCFRERYGTSD